MHELQAGLVKCGNRVKVWAMGFECGGVEGDGSGGLLVGNNETMV